MRAFQYMLIASFLMLTRVFAEVSIEIDLSEQRAFLIENGDIMYQTPIASGRASHPTPTGEFRVTEKDLDHRSSLYGKIVDSEGNVIKGDADSDTPVPAGGKFVQAPMRYFLRFNGAIGMHAGILPGYPASHGCVRLPSGKASLFYELAEVGTPVRVYGVAPYRREAPRRTRVSEPETQVQRPEPPPVRRVPFFYRLF